MNNQQQWKRVLERDGRWNDVFVYAVRSTGIYCRPSCPSRRPRREQVVFYPRAQAAERAGFRPCRRCKPQLARRNDPLIEKVRRACQYIDAHAEDSLTLASLSAHLGGSPYHLQRIFKRVMGITPRRYAEIRRLERFKAHVKDRQNVTHALYEAGYGSSSRLYERAPTKLGMTPSEYRRGGKGIRIRYTIVACPEKSLGRLLLAATESGICRVSLGDRDRFLEADLRREFPAAEIRRDGVCLRAWAAALLKHLDGHRTHLNLPLDVRATAFQWRVWEALRSIPLGSTRAYSEVARALGQPKAARAVARACATNPVSVIVPCHRVVQANGGLGGYHWGIERKKMLLAIEKKTSETRRQARFLQ